MMIGRMRKGMEKGRVARGRRGKKGGREERERKNHRRNHGGERP